MWSFFYVCFMSIITSLKSYRVLYAVPALLTVDWRPSTSQPTLAGWRQLVVSTVDNYILHQQLCLQLWRAMHLVLSSYHSLFIYTLLEKVIKLKMAYPLTAGEPTTQSNSHFSLAGCFFFLYRKWVGVIGCTFCYFAFRHLESWNCEQV